MCIVEDSGAIFSANLQEIAAARGDFGAGLFCEMDATAAMSGVVVEFRFRGSCSALQSSLSEAVKRTYQGGRPSYLDSPTTEKKFASWDSFQVTTILLAQIQFGLSGK